MVLDLSKRKEDTLNKRFDKVIFPAYKKLYSELNMFLIERIGHYKELTLKEQLKLLLLLLKDSYGFHYERMKKDFPDLAKLYNEL